MRLRNPLKRFGGQYYTAPKIVSLLPPHTTYCEPYFGSGAVLFAKECDGVSEVVNDIEQDLSLFWMALQSDEAFPLLYRKAIMTPFSEHSWKAAGRFLAIEAPDVEDRFWHRHPGSLADRAYWFMVHVRHSMGGRQDRFAPISKERTRQGMNEQAAAWLSSVNGLPLVHERLKRVAILAARPALEVIRKFDREGTLFYLDPPFPETTRVAGGYKHEMTTKDHCDLLDAIRACKGKVAISTFPNDLYRQALGAWNCHTFDLPNNASHAAEKERETHLLYTNF